ncbi:hypothetical protein FBU31_003619, partial [Coemansia sp. 'formosensis']
MPLSFAAAPDRSVSAFDIALDLVGGINSAGQMSTVNTPALTLLCSEDENGHSTHEVLQGAIAGMHNQCSDIDLFLNSLKASLYDPLAMFGFDSLATVAAS